MLNFVFAAVLCSNVTAPFTGTLCTPNDGKRHVAMLLLGGSEGGNSMGRSAKSFAEHGYVAASVAYFHMPGLPQALVDIPVETVKPAINTLLARSDVSGRMGALGISKGGELVLLAASTYPQIKATIAIVPSPFAYMGLNEQDMPTACSWTKGGKELPCIPPNADANASVMQEAMSGKPLVLTPMYESSLKKDAAVTAAATFPLEKINGPVLCLGGMDDQMWPSNTHCIMAMRYLKRHHHAYSDRSINYASAGHTFIMAINGPKSAMISYSWGSGSMAFGGTPQGDADAATSAWKSIWSFLKASLGS